VEPATKQPPKEEEKSLKEKIEELQNQREEEKLKTSQDLLKFYFNL
jgi:hypothetical protein